MAISIACPLCKAAIRLPDNAAGKKFRCPKCKGTIAVKGAAPPKPMIMPGAVESGLTDAPREPESGPPIEEPLPISALAKKAMQEEFNPFDEGSADVAEDKPKHKRYWQPKENYNPFAEPPAQETEDGANPEDLFDFGREEGAPGGPKPKGEFDFGGHS